MADHKLTTPAADSSCFKEAVCIDVDKVYDSCADRDCLEDLRVYFPSDAQAVIDRSGNVRCRKAEILQCFIDVEPVQFNRGYYSVDITFCFRVTVDAYVCQPAPPQCLDGLCVFTKKAILYGSEGNVKVFSSEYFEDDPDRQLVPETTNPKAKVQVVDPVILGARVADLCNCCGCDCDCDLSCYAPACVCKAFPGCFGDHNAQKAVYVSLGLFTIVQLEREVQLMIPAYDFCVPDKECSCSVANDDPCAVFKKIKFPHEEFFPKDSEPDGCKKKCF